MTYTVFYSKRFRKSVRLAKRRHLPVDELKAVVAKLKDDIPLEARHCDHALTGDKRGFRECHIQNDWLLLYKKERDILILTLLDTGTHGDLFGK